MKGKKETAQQAFRRLATARTRKALWHINLIGNLSNRSNYYFEEEEIEKIITALDEAINDIRKKFTKPVQIEFKL